MNTSRTLDDVIAANVLNAHSRRFTPANRYRRYTRWLHSRCTAELHGLASIVLALGFGLGVLYVFILQALFR
jgi:flagellar basal body rod protein FlgC